MFQPSHYATHRLFVVSFVASFVEEEIDKARDKVWVVGEARAL
jgi:hypothetical protein